MSLKFKFHAFAKESWKNCSAAGNRTLVARVPGENTHHYTTEDSCWRVSSQRMNARDCWEGKKRVEKKMFPCGESNPGRGGESAES